MRLRSSPASARGPPPSVRRLPGHSKPWAETSLPALDAALRSPDAAVRSRVLPVWERVQKRLLVRPTMVRLEGKGRPLAEVVRSIGKQARILARNLESGFGASRDRS